jgi:hypothetical protein
MKPGKSQLKSASDERGAFMNEKKRLLSMLALVVSFALLAQGCGGGGKPATATSGNAPKSPVGGYYSANQSLSGGTNLNYINLRDIQIKMSGPDTIIALEFVDGSLPLGIPEVATKGVPKYSTQWIQGLNRLVLSVSGLYYWDYRVYEDELQDTPIIGIFKQTPVNNDVTKLYVNLKDNIAYKVEEQKNYLLIYLRAVPETEDSDYYVVLYAFDDYSEGKIPDKEEMLPTLCSDKTNVMLISKPFANVEDANAFLEEKKKSLLPSLPNKIPVVQKLKSTQLPDYDAKGVLAAYANSPVMKTGGVPSPAPVFITNGRILCWRPDGMAYVYATPFFLGGNGGTEATRYEKIYMSVANSPTPTLLSNIEYTNIGSAEFSDDGRYLAFMEEGEGDNNRTLYIYDFNGSLDQVATAAEAGFGVDTASFTWGSGDNAHTIYAITGEGNMLQLMSYKLMDSGEPKVDTLVENAFTEGEMGFYDGKVYYSQYDSEATDPLKNGIFTYDTATRAISHVSAGFDFLMNRKSGEMAVLYDISTDTKSSYDLRVYDPVSKLEKPVVHDKYIVDYTWSGDGSSLYYTYDRGVDKQDDQFVLSLNQYNTLTGETKEVADTVDGLIRPSDKKNEVLLIVTYTEQEENSSVPITYRVGPAADSQQ